ncbi:hypothetical protein VE00_05923 [Pseudogymnoascus sp. WSF 3629]|nr:hypothetical protein VE00_05923 [Pseudogymnoascus sp. WSF 3629]
MFEASLPHSIAENKAIVTEIVDSPLLRWSVQTIDKAGPVIIGAQNIHGIDEIKAFGENSERLAGATFTEAVAPQAGDHCVRISRLRVREPEMGDFQLLRPCARSNNSRCYQPPQK